MSKTKQTAISNDYFVVMIKVCILHPFPKRKHMAFERWSEFEKVLSRLLQSCVLGIPDTLITHESFWNVEIELKSIQCFEIQIDFFKWKKATYLLVHGYGLFSSNSKHILLHFAHFSCSLMTLKYPIIFHTKNIDWFMF